MGPRSTALPILLLVGGCSILYNPNNITAPPADAAIDVIDAAPDADPAALTLVSVEPDSVVEGQGDDGSRMAMLVVHGTNITSDAKISIAPMDGSATPMVSSMPGQEAISADHSLIAVPVTALVNTTCDADGIDLVVTVTQNGGAVTKTIPWKVACLPQVDESGSGAGSNQALPTGVNQFSRFVLAGSDTITLAGGADLTKQLIVRVTGKLSVPAGIVVSANNATPGPGGQPPATGDGRGGDGSVGGLLGLGGPDEGGGGAGYAAKGGQGTNNDTTSAGPVVGTDAITSFASCYASGGGNYATSGTNSNLGGAGGGTIELTAGGSLTVAGIVSRGGTGTATRAEARAAQSCSARAAP